MMDENLKEICKEIILTGVSIRDYVLTPEQQQQVLNCVNEALKIW